jgi:F-type H+-transporting ATPase subunit beta
MSVKTATGRVARVIGPVVDIEFPADAMPAIFNALNIEVTLAGETKKLTLEVAQHIGDNLVRAILCNQLTAWFVARLLLTLEVRSQFQLVM